MLGINLLVTVITAILMGFSVIPLDIPSLILLVMLGLNHAVAIWNRQTMVDFMTKLGKGLRDNQKQIYDKIDKVERRVRDQK